MIASSYLSFALIVGAEEKSPPDSMLPDCIETDCIARRCVSLAEMVRYLIDGIGDESVHQNWNVVDT